MNEFRNLIHAELENRRREEITRADSHQAILRELVETFNRDRRERRNRKQK
ncbi:MAG: hypothetical protein ACOCXZ_01820 [Chloroflexota bacterium]